MLGWIQISADLFDKWFNRSQPDKVKNRKFIVESRITNVTFSCSLLAAWYFSAFLACCSLYQPNFPPHQILFSLVRLNLTSNAYASFSFSEGGGGVQVGNMRNALPRFRRRIVSMKSLSLIKHYELTCFRVLHNGHGFRLFLTGGSSR